MKQLVFAIITAIIGVLNANAQVLTKETVNNLFDKMVYQSNSDFVFNAERTDSDITTMFVYQKNFDRKGTMTLKPHLKYDYSYDADGTLTSRIAYHWLEGKDRTTGSALVATTTPSTVASISPSTAATTTLPSASTSPSTRWSTC